MGDSDDDWEAAADNFKAPVSALAAAKLDNGASTTKGASVLAAVNEPDMARFADEDQGDAPEPEKHVIKSQVRRGGLMAHMHGRRERRRPVAT